MKIRKRKVFDRSKRNKIAHKKANYSIVVQDLIEQLGKQPKIYYVNSLPSPYRGACIPPIGIYIKKEHQEDKSILIHELIHWRQYKRMGLFMYYLRYFVQLFFIGYATMPMEMEARQFESEKDRWNYIYKYHKKH